MTLTDAELRQAEKRMRARLKGRPHVIAARYDRRTARVVAILNNGLELGFPVRLVQGLTDATVAELSNIEISPTGLGLHWPLLDADLYLPALIEGAFGTRRWMARIMGKAGGSSTSSVKRRAAQENGKLGGRPRKATAPR